MRGFSRELRMRILEREWNYHGNKHPKAVFLVEFFGRGVKMTAVRRRKDFIMKAKLQYLCILLALLAGIHQSAAQGTTAFTYQGRLNSGGAPASGSYDIAFTLFGTNAGGVAIAWPVTNSTVDVTNGLFTTTMDFGNVFTGGSNWLEIAVSTNGANSFTTLTPRQQLTPVPYAEFAFSVSGLTIQQNSDGAPNVIGGASVNYVSNSVVGATIGGGGAVNYYGYVWTNSVTADFSTVSGGENNTASGGSATVGGGGNNTASGNNATVSGGQGDTASGASATVSGGYHDTASGDDATVSGGYGNTASQTDATVGGGYGNTASGLNATVGGGSYNTNSGYNATIGGGYPNTASVNDATVGGGGGNTASGDSATVGGGDGNTASGSSATVGGGGGNTASGSSATVGGGQDNTATNEYSTVSGGFANTATNYSATVAGGTYNTASGDSATVGGGYNNTASGSSATVGGGQDNTASGLTATVGGGFDNTASGDYSFAAGQFAHAVHTGAFVWADSQSGTYASDRNNEFKIRAGGGVQMDVSGSSGLNPAAVTINSTSANGVGLFVSLAGGSSDAALVLANTGTGDILKGFSGASANTLAFEVQNDGTVKSKGVVLTSDRNAKANFTSLDAQAILAKIIAMPVTEWNYKDDAVDKKHIGPMAQDFHAAFGLDGADDKHISVVDEGGVALAAIQGLNQKLEIENAKLQQQNDSLARRLDELQKTVQSLVVKK
jgi:trimeric autotransporter adhesin